MDLTLPERAFLVNDIESAVTNECLGDDEEIYKKFEDIAYKMIDRRQPLDADERKLLANWLQSCGRKRGWNKCTRICRKSVITFVRRCGKPAAFTT